MSYVLTKNLKREVTSKNVNNLTFYIFVFYMISFLLHFGERIPIYGRLRLDLLIVLILSLLLLSQLNKITDRFNDKSNKYLFIYILYIILSLPFVEWPGSVINNFNLFVKASVFFYFPILVLDTSERIKLLIKVYLFCELFRVIEPLFLNIFFGYWGSSTHFGGGEFVNRLSGAPSDIINPNGLAFVIATVYIYIHIFWTSSGYLLKILYALVVPLIIYALILTLSRTGLVSMGVIFCFIFLYSKYKKLLIVLFIAGFLATWSNLTVFQKDRYLSLIGSKDASSSQIESARGRINGLISNLHVIESNPFVGFGLGTSKEASYNYAGSAKIAHIFIIEIIMDTGIIGCLIYIFFLKSIRDQIKNAKIKIRELENNGRAHSDEIIYFKKLCHILHISFWMYLISSLAQDGLLGYHWYFLAGMVVVSYKMINKLVEVETKTFPA